LISFIYIFLFISFNKNTSIYTGNEKILYGYIISKTLDGDKLTITLKAKEKIIINYYLKEKEEIGTINKCQLGDYIKIKGELIRPKNNTVFNLFNYKKYLSYKNIYWLFNAEQIIKIKSNKNIFYKIKQNIINRINKIPYSGNYTNMLTLGDKSLIDSDILDYYKINGISHLFAISGMNITLLAFILLFVLKKIKIKELPSYLIITVFLSFYLFLTNYTSSVSRAVVFFILLSINKIYYLHIKSINLLILTFCILIFINPYNVFEIGFQLSFAISFYLLLFQKLINKYSNYIIKTFVISVISFLSSMPIIIYNFFEINLLSPLINIIFVPLVSIIIFPLSLITFILPVFDKILYLLIQLLEFLSLYISKIS
jgi:competence protein ComEC